MIPSQTAEPNAVSTRQPPEIRLGYTYQRPDGNRYLPGRGSVPETAPLHIPLGGRPQWLVAAPAGDASIWVAVLEDGSVQAFSIADGQVQDQPITPGILQPGMPPLLMLTDGSATLVPSLDTKSSNLTSPVVLQPSGNMAYIRSNGDLVVRIGGQSTVLPLNALPDARLLTDEDERLLLLTGATGSYPHGGGQNRSAERDYGKYEAEGAGCLDGAFARWGRAGGYIAHLDRSGRRRTREILITVSNSRLGARLVVLNDAGDPVAFGPAVGRSSRWRHQLAAAPFGPSGELEVVDVVTLHICGTVEFYRLEEDSLRVVAKVPGFRTHAIGSRNLDMAVAGDFDSDGRLELLVPSQGMDEIGAIRRTEAGAEVAWVLPIDGKVSTNLAAVTTDTGGLMLGLGTDDGVLLVWPGP